MKILIFVTLSVVLGTVVGLSPCHCDLTEPENHVCGTDGNTYKYLCNLKCVMSLNPNIKIAYKGPCNVIYVKRPCHCSNRKYIVCGTDGRNYTNDCHLKCATRENHNIQLAHNGQCKTG